MPAICYIDWQYFPVSSFFSETKPRKGWYFSKQRLYSLVTTNYLFVHLTQTLEDTNKCVLKLGLTIIWISLLHALSFDSSLTYSLFSAYFWLELLRAKKTTPKPPVKFRQNWWDMSAVFNSKRLTDELRIRIRVPWHVLYKDRQANHYIIGRDRQYFHEGRTQHMQECLLQIILICSPTS